MTKSWIKKQMNPHSVQNIARTKRVLPKVGTIGKHRTQPWLQSKALTQRKFWSRSQDRLQTLFRRVRKGQKGQHAGKETTPYCLRCFMRYVLEAKLASFTWTLGLGCRYGDASIPIQIQCETRRWVALSQCLTYKYSPEQNACFT